MVRLVRMTALAILLLATWTAVASAARIDPELKRMLEEKSGTEIFPVLMVFSEAPDLDELEVQLDGVTPSKRRKSVIAALKRQSRKAQTDAWEILDDPDLPGTLLYADMLYISNSITFAADREVIMAMVADKSADEAILFYDKDYELLGDAVRGPAEPVKTARTDTVWSVQYIHADDVWNELGITGAGVLIGHIDTGVAFGHPDLRDRVSINSGEVPDNGIDDDENGFIDDDRGWDFGDRDNSSEDDAVIAGHGTHTAGTVVGDGTGGIQTGVAPGAMLLPVKIFTSEGMSSLSRIWFAQQYCIEMGCRVITMSLGIKGDIPEPYLRNDRYNALGMRAAGVMLFNSAGNEHAEFDPPIELGMTARIPAPWSELPVPYSSTGGVVTVGATGLRSDDPYPAGSQGPAGWGQIDPWYDWPYLPGQGLIKPDVSAPGVGIQSTLPSNMYSGETWSGTSMSCPHAAGVAALMLEMNPTLSPAGIDSLLEQTARDLGAVGKDVVFGAGIIDAYAAVSAVPTDLVPDLSEVEFLPDPMGDGVLDPGEFAAVVFDVRNAGIAAATGVIGQLFVDENPYVAVQSATASFPDIPGGTTASNLTAPFILAISPVAPQSATFSMTLVMVTAEGFERAFDVDAAIGLPEFRTHDVSNVYLTVTSRGSLGYLTDAQLDGQGMGLLGTQSSLFTASLWAGDSPYYVCNNDLIASGADPADWVPRLDPSGNVSIVTDGVGEQIFAMAFTDSGHVAPRGVEVVLTSRACADPGRSHVVILDYQLTNVGATTLEEYHAGLFADWDVIDLFCNVGGVDLNTRSVWVGMPDGPVFGLAVLGETPVSNITLVDNLIYIYPLSHVTDTHKYEFLSGDLHQSSVTAPTDLSALVSVGPLTLVPGQHAVVSFLMGYGANADDFVANVVAAGGGSGPVTNVEQTLPAAPVALAQNAPNPFNPSTEIRFGMPTPGPVSLAVYDLSGRLVRTLVDEPRMAGDHVVRWDGLDDRGGQVASGLYLYRLTAGGTTLSRKMTVVK